MKKLLALILTVITVMSMVSCGKTDVADNQQDTVIEQEVEANTEAEETEKTDDKKPQAKPEVKPEEKPEAKPEVKPEEKPEVNTETPKTVGNVLLADFKSKATGSATALSIAEALSQNSIIQFGAMAMEVSEGYLTGFDNAEINGFSEGAVFAPMIGTIPFVGYVFTLKDGVNANDFIANLKANANLRWNICTQAEEMVAGSVGNKVFFVMTNKSFDEE